MSLRSILIIDDDAFIRTLVGRTLSLSSDFVVHMCSNGAEAVEAVPRLRPDLILLDVVMPGMDGPATLKAIRALPEGAAAVVVFMTAPSQRFDKQALLDLGAIDVLTKPFDAPKLVDTIQGIWNRARVSDGGDDLAEELSRIRRRFLKDIPQRIREMRASWARVVEQPDGAARREDVATLHRAAHSLHGAAASFEVSAVAALAGALESLLEARPGGDFTGEETERVRAMLHSLDRTAMHTLFRDSGDGEAGAPEAATPDDRDAETGDDRPLLLLVDDMEVVRQRMRAAFEAAGYRVSEAEDGQAAVELARDRTPDVVLMDVIMPRLDGFGAVRAMRSHAELADVPVLFMTTTQKMSLQQVQDALAYGVCGYLAKTTPLDEIVRAVREAHAKGAVA